MILSATAVREELVDISIGNAAIVALMGYLVVFFGIVLLMYVIIVMGKIFVAKANKAKAAAQPAPAPAAQPAPAPAAQPVPAAAPAPAEAPGTAGQLKLHDVPPKTAAMLMAIVANQMGKPLNELRFISIKEVK